MHQESHLHFRGVVTCSVQLVTANYGPHYLGTMTTGDWVMMNVDANLGFGSTAVKVAQQKGASVILSI